MKCKIQVEHANAKNSWITSTSLYISITKSVDEMEVNKKGIINRIMTSSMAQQYENYVTKRYPRKPLEQPSYRMRDIPFCEKYLKGSTIEEIEGRDIVNNAMTEMILLTTETREEEKLANLCCENKRKSE